MYLPQNPNQVKKMLGLQRAAQHKDRKVEAGDRNQSAKKGGRVDSASSSKSKGREREDVSLAINAAGVPLHLTDTVTFDADFECANVDQIRRKNMHTYDVFIRNDSNGN